MFRLKRIVSLVTVLSLGLLLSSCAAIQSLQGPPLEPLPQALEGQEVIEKEMGEPIKSGDRLITVKEAEFGNGAGKIRCHSGLYKVKQGFDGDWLSVTITIESTVRDRWLRIYPKDLKLAVMDEKGRWARPDEEVQQRSGCDDMPKIRVRGERKRNIYPAFRMQPKDMQDSDLALYMDIVPTYERGDKHTKVEKKWVKVDLDVE